MAIIKFNPEKLGEMVDALYSVKQKLAAANKAARAIKDDHDHLAFQIQEHLISQDLFIAAGKIAKFSLNTETSAQLDDKVAFINWAVENGRWDMIPTKVNGAPFREYLEQENKNPDGVTPYNKLKISLTKK